MYPLESAKRIPSVAQVGNTARIEENLKVFDFELEEDDVRKIADLTGCVGLSGNPDTMPF